MGLTGEIKTMPLTDLLQWIETTRKSGIVECRAGTEWKKIFFQEGQIIFASSARESEKLGQHLIRQERIRESDLIGCLHENEQTGKKLTQILEDRGLISHDDLYGEVVILIKEILFDLFLWEEGLFQFRDRELPDSMISPLALKTGQVLFEVLNRIDENRRDGILPEKGATAGPTKSTGIKVKGRIIFKVDDKKFTLPGAYEKREIPSFRKDEEAEGNKD
ncbi:MAG: DUF4388 domain-containing protein [Deltaproteobacteria bacterium]|nr:DUF4388 domain-containing protein [Deltaproteobacteria bacterium]